MHPRTLQGLAQAAYANRDVTSAVAYYLRAWETVVRDPTLATRIANELAYVCLYDLRDVRAAERWAQRMEATACDDIDMARLGLLRKRLAASTSVTPRTTFTAAGL